MSPCGANKEKREEPLGDVYMGGRALFAVTQDLHLDARPTRPATQSPFVTLLVLSHSILFCAYKKSFFFLLKTENKHPEERKKILFCFHRYIAALNIVKWKETVKKKGHEN